MIPTTFEGSNCTYAEDQEEFLSLPAHKAPNERCIVTTCWRLTWRERLLVLVRGRLWFQQMTWSQPLQAQKPAVHPPELERGTCERCRDTRIVACQGCEGRGGACAGCNGAGVIRCRVCENRAPSELSKE